VRLHRLFLVPVLVAAPTLAACQSAGEPAVTANQVASANPLKPPIVPQDTYRGTFLPFKPDAKAVTYNQAVVPAGATAQVTTTMTAKGMIVRLAVTGMIPRRAYGAHLHTQPCTAEPAMAGPHYQHNPDPEMSASPDPAFANPHNEVWLDFTADARGAATAVSAEDWAFDEMHPPKSLVVHAASTRTGKGVAGTAGPRVACLTLTP
jgi:Cu-Zn family superoxide dismutase